MFLLSSSSPKCTACQESIIKDKVFLGFKQLLGRCSEPGDWRPVPWHSSFTPECDVIAGTVGRVRTVSCEPLARQGGSTRRLPYCVSSARGFALLTCPLLTPHGSEGGVVSGLYPTQLCSASAVVLSSLWAPLNLFSPIPHAVSRSH